MFGAVIVANAIVARFVKDPTEPRFIWRAVPIQLVGLALLIIGNLLSPHVWLWSVLGTSLYAFGIGLIFPTLFRFTLFSNNLPKGTVSASLNMVILMVMSVSVEIGRWLWFNGGRLPFHLLAVVAGVIVVFTGGIAQSRAPTSGCRAGGGAVIFARSCRQALFLTL